MGITLAILRQAGKTSFETHSFNSEAKIGEVMSTIHLKAKEGISFIGDLFDSHERNTFLTSTKWVGKLTKVYCNLPGFSLGLKDGGGMLLARVLVTDEKYSLKGYETFDGSDAISLLTFNFIFGPSTFGLLLMLTNYKLSFTNTR